MQESERDLDVRITDYWRDGPTKERAQAIIRQALTSPPRQLRRALRAMQVITTYETLHGATLPPSLSESISAFSEHVARLRTRVVQVDLIGDPQTDLDAAFFEVLGDDIAIDDPATYDAVRLEAARNAA